MSIIKPFKAHYYSPRYIRHLSSLACPPYDVIDKKDERNFKRSSPFNFCNVLLTDEKNDYKTLARTFSGWIDKGVMVQDKKSSLYLYEQTFKARGSRIRRFGFLGLLKLDQEGLVTPHENTFKGPKKDRLSIVKAFGANLTPIFTIIPGRLSILHEAYAECREHKPFLHCKDAAGIINRIWRIEESSFIRRVQDAFAHKRFFIADGHHRFEVGYRYFQMMKKTKRFKDLNYIFAYFTDSQSGIQVFPTHRIVAARAGKKEFFSKIKDFFDITQVPAGAFKRTLAGVNAVPFGMFYKGKYYLLRLKNTSLLDTISKRRKEEVYKKLNVYILHTLVLPYLRESAVEYAHTVNDALERAGTRKWAFILKPTSLDEIFAIARKGCRLPQKTTYFYPKLLSGLIVRRFEETEQR